MPRPLRRRATSAGSGPTDTGVDEAFLKALFAAPANTPTDVVEGSDGIFRIGRSTEISAASVDSAYQAKIQNDGVAIDHYRTVVAADVLHKKLQDKIVASLVGPGPQRRVSEIYIKEATPPPAAGAIKVRHILYSPNGDPANASKVAADDPAWARARSLATEAYAKLKTDPSLFDSIARKESDEESALGPTGTRRQAPVLRQHDQRRPRIHGGDLSTRTSSPATSCRLSSPRSAGM